MGIKATSRNRAFKGIAVLWITLQQGVDFVLKNFERMHGGEIFVPKIPSIRMVDLAKAMAPELSHRVVGIRPGEKMHEQMIGTEDSIYTFEYEDYYKILPSLFNWSKDKKRMKTFFN